MPEYISIKEFAKRAGTTPQAVYQRINHGLSEYATKDERGNWRISTDALREYDQPESEQGVCKAEQHVEQGVEQGLQDLIQALQTPYRELTNALQGQIADLQRQIDDRDATITAKDAQIADMVGRIATLAENAQHIQGIQLAQLSQINADPTQTASANTKKKPWAWLRKKKP